MSEIELELSAYIDGELSDNDSLALEKKLETDAELRALLDSLIAADERAKSDFDAMLHIPVPAGLIDRITDFQPQAPANANRQIHLNTLLRLAASAAFVSLVGLGGFTYGQSSVRTELAAQSGWLNDIAEYHAIYEGQKRHLVEVAASESDHIEKWLGTTVGIPFSTPDLSANGLTYQGSRLLAAAGKPVAQLIYTDAQGTVVALCLMASDKPAQDIPVRRDINGYQMVSWHDNGAAYVIVAPATAPDMGKTAKDAQIQI